MTPLAAPWSKSSQGRRLPAKMGCDFDFNPTFCSKVIDRRKFCEFLVLTGISMIWLAKNAPTMADPTCSMVVQSIRHSLSSATSERE
jgi:hypothetical protein